MQKIGKNHHNLPNVHRISIIPSFHDISIQNVPAYQVLSSGSPGTPMVLKLQDRDERGMTGFDDGNFCAGSEKHQLGLRMLVRELMKNMVSFES